MQQVARLVEPLSYEKWQLKAEQLQDFKIQSLSACSLLNPALPLKGVQPLVGQLMRPCHYGNGVLYASGNKQTAKSRNYAIELKALYIV